MHRSAGFVLLLNLLVAFRSALLLCASLLCAYAPPPSRDTSYPYVPSIVPGGME
jgi:hypothetical protein